MEVIGGSQNVMMQKNVSRRKENLNFCHFLCFSVKFFLIIPGVKQTLAWWLESLPIAWKIWVQAQVESYQTLKK